MRPPLPALRSPTSRPGSTRRSPGARLAAAALAAALGCGGGSESDPDAGGADDAGPADAAPPDAAPAPVPLTLDLLTAPTTADEVAEVRASWAARDTAARDVTVEATGSLTLGETAMTYLVLAHSVGGLRHVGAVLVPDGLSSPASAAVLIYAHGGLTVEGGLPPFRVEDLASRAPGDALRGQLVLVIPAYRGERIEVAGVTYTGEGTPSIGDREVDDVMALLSAALA